MPLKLKKRNGPTMKFGSNSLLKNSLKRYHPQVTIFEANKHGKNFSVSWLPFFGKRRSSSVKGIGAGRASLEWIDVDWWVIICIGNALEWEIMHDFNQTSKPWFNWQTWSQLWSTSKILICVFIIIFTPGCKRCEYIHISAPCGFPCADVYSVLCLSTRKKKSIALYESPSIFVSFFLIFHFLPRCAWSVCWITDLNK